MMDNNIRLEIFNERIDQGQGGTSLVEYGIPGLLQYIRIGKLVKAIG
jgi:hypothetical protein